MRVLRNIFNVCEILILFSALGRDAVDKQAKDLVIEQITQACKDVGFFYLSGHGVEKSSLNQIFTATKNFFALPLKKKMPSMFVTVHCTLDTLKQVCYSLVVAF